MSFLYLITINGEEVPYVNQGTSLLEKLEEPMDSGQMTIAMSIRGIPHKMFGLLQIRVYQDNEYQTLLDTFDYLIIDDQVSNEGAYGYYTHNFAVSEYSAKLNVYNPNNIAKTNDILNSNTAPFDTKVDGVALNYFYVNNLNPKASNSVFMNVVADTIKVNSQYYSNEIITFNKVKKAKQITDWDALTDGDDYSFDFVLSDVFLESNAFSGSFNLSNGDVNLSFPKGKWYLDYKILVHDSINGENHGIVNGQKYTLFRYYIEVIDRQTFTIYDLVMSVRQNISKFGGIESKKYFDMTRVFNIDLDIVEYLKSIQAPQTYIQNANARQTLNGIFNYVNAISRLKWNGGRFLEPNDTDILTMDEFNKRSGEFIESDIVSKASNQSATQIGVKSYSPIEMALPTDLERPTVKLPTNQRGKTVRGINIEMNDSSFELKLPQPIYMLKKISVKLGNISVGVKVGENIVVSWFINNFELDLTSRFLNYDEWKLQKITTDYPEYDIKNGFSDTIGYIDNKGSSLYWKQGESKINLSVLDDGVVIQDKIIVNLIKEQVQQFLTTNGSLYYDLHEDPNYWGVVEPMRVVFLNSSIESTTNNFRNLKFNVEYITQENVVSRVDRKDLSDFDYYSELRSNQSDKRVNIMLETQRVFGDMQRSGVVVHSFKKRHTDYDTIYKMGAIDKNGFVIIQRKFTFYNNYIDVDYLVSKDHNRIAQFVGINQDYRWSQIPTDNQVFERIENYVDYIVLSRKKDVYNDLDIKIRDIAVEEIFQTLITNPLELPNGEFEKRRITSALIQTDGMLEVFDEEGIGKDNYVISEISSMEMVHGLIFKFGFNGNQVAGDGIKKINNAWYNEAVRYTNRQGRFNELFFDLTNELNNLNTDEEQQKYPLYKRNINDKSYFRTGGYNWYESEGANDNLIIDKDPMQNIHISYQVNVVSDFDEPNLFYIGKEFFTQNTLIKNVENKDMYIYLYSQDYINQYNVFNKDYILDGYVKKVLLTKNNVEFYYNFDNVLNIFLDIDMEDYQMWAIGDNFGNNYVACMENLNEILAHTIHIPTVYKEIGKGIAEIPYYGEVKSFEKPYELITNYYAESSETERKIMVYDLVSSKITLDYSIGENKSMYFDLESTKITNDIDYGDSKIMNYNLFSTTISNLLSYGENKIMSFDLSKTLISNAINYGETKFMFFDLTTNYDNEIVRNNFKEMSFDLKETEITNDFFAGNNKIMDYTLPKSTISHSLDKSSNRTMNYNLTSTKVSNENVLAINKFMDYDLSYTYVETVVNPSIDKTMNFDLEKTIIEQNIDVAKNFVMNYDLVETNVGHDITIEELKNMSYNLSSDISVDFIGGGGTYQWTKVSSLSSPYDYTIPQGNPLPEPNSVGLRLRRVLSVVPRNTWQTSTGYSSTPGNAIMGNTCFVLGEKRATPFGLANPNGGFDYPLLECKYSGTGTTVYEYYISELK